MLILRILAFVFIVPGFVMVFAARLLVKRFNLDKNVKVAFENEMTEEEIVRYKLDKAVLNVKIISFIFTTPGLVLLLIAFRHISNG